MNPTAFRSDSPCRNFVFAPPDFSRRRRKAGLTLLATLAGLIWAATLETQAAVSVTAPTNGTGIPADKALNGVAPAFTTLGDIVILEGVNTDFSITNSATLILTVPSGWQFNPGVGTATGTKVSGAGGNELSVNNVSVTATNLTITYSVSNDRNINRLTISGLQVRATEGGLLPIAGNLLRTAANPGTGTIAGITNDVTDFGPLSQAVGALRLFTVLPGQTFTDANTVAGSGISGVPTSQTAGQAFDLTQLVAADRQFNIDGTYGGAKTINYSGPGGTPNYTTAVNFTAGQATTALTTTLNKAETTTLTATDGTVAGVASSNLTVNAGAFVKLQLLAPGETAAGGTTSGKTGTPNPQTVGAPFNVTVNAVDVSWNLIPTVTDTVALASSDANATLPPDAALLSGTNTFPVTLRTAGTQTLTARDTTDTNKLANTSPLITVQKAGTATALNAAPNPSCFGQSVTFTANVTVTPPGSGTAAGNVDFKDGTNLLGSATLDASAQATFSTSSLATGSRSITAQYSGNTNFNPSTSLVATQLVNLAPSVALQPTNRTVCANSPVTFLATGTGLPAPTLQWQVSADGGTNFTDLPGATATNLTFNPAPADDGKQYHAVFSNLCGTATTTNATLTVIAFPGCNIAGADRLCTNTTGNLFSAPAGATIYRWTITGSGTISGATNAQTVSVNSTAAGTFTLNLALTNAADCGAACSKIVTNVIRPSATVSGGGTICLGNNTNVQAALTGTGPWIVTWSDGFTTNAAASPAIRSVSPASTTIYTVTAVSYVDSACSTNTGTGSATVTVNTAPQVTLHPINLIVCSSNAQTFTATAAGTPAPAVLWQVSTNGGLSFSNIAGATGTNYTFTNSINDNGKQYRARFTNVCGTVFSTAATLTVIPRPTATVSGSASICAGSNAVIQATLTGTSPWTVVWSDNVTNNNVATNVLTRVVNPATNTTYTVKSVADASCTNTGTGSAVISLSGGVSATPLQNQVRVAGGSVIFSTIASGTGPFSYMWQKDGTNLVAQTNSTLYLVNLTTNDTGTYCIIVGGDCGSVTPCATLTVNACYPAVDVMMVIDRSGSMAGQAYTDAKTACTNLVQNLNLNTNADQAGLVSYNTAATLDRSLTNSSSVLEQSIATLPAASGNTCISCGLQTGQTELVSVRHHPASLPILVLMSDGLPTGGDTGSNALFVATQAKNAGTRIFTVGLGAVDDALMAGIASSTNDYYHATNSSQLTALFNAISAAVCRPSTNITVLGPSNTTACAGTVATLSVNASGCDSFNYQWQKDGAFLAGQNNSSLVISNANTTNAGVYTVIITSTCRNLTNNATLTVFTNTTAAALIPQVLCPGNNAPFSTVASGTGPFTYQWTKDGSVLAGRTNSSLTVSNVASANAGQYCVIVTGNCNTVTNCTTLTVTTNLTANGPVNLTNCPGTAAVFTTLTDGTGPMLYQWLRNGAVISGATNSALTIASVQAADAGTYCVQINATCSSATNCATLTVLTNTSATPFASLTNCPGTAAGFATVASGTGPFTYQWTQNGQPIADATDSTYSISAVEATNAGIYCVTVTGACGTATNCATLAVTTNLSATPLLSLTNCVGAAAGFSTLVSGTGPFSFQWVKDGAPILGATNNAYALAAVDATNAGLYCVEVTGFCASVTNCASLTVRSGTSATALTSLTNCPGATASFSTTVTADGPVSYQWTRGGSLVNGETNNSLTISNVTAADAGTYCVEVTSSCGHVTNCASLTVLTNASATALTSLTNCPGGAANFSTLAGGTGPFAYRWTKDGAPLNGQISSALTINGATSADAGVYCVEVTGACGSVTNCATLTVLTNTSATALTSLTNCLGSSAAFSTIASGTGPFSYQWTKNGSPLSGQTDSALTLTNITGGDAGTYCVVVVGFCNRVTNCAVLTVLTNASATALTPLTRCPGGAATFSTIASGTGPFTYRWTEDGGELTGETNSSVTISDLVAADAGIYCVEVTSPCGSVTNCTTLTVLTNTAATSLASHTNCPGGTANFSTTASGTGPFSYQWTRNGGALGGATNSSLAISNLTAANAGQYCVMVTGNCNSVTNCTTLTVLTNTLATGLVSQTNCPGSTVNFSTVASGTGPFSYQWTKDGGALAGATNSSLAISNLTAANAGQYCVMVTGNCNSVTNCATLTVLTNTSATQPGNLTLCPGSTATFSTTASGAGPFSYQWSKAGSPLGGATSSSLTLSNIASVDAAQYCVQVTGACGSATNCATLTVATNTTATPLASLTLCQGSPASFSTTAGGAGPFTYQWTKNGTNLSGAINSSYAIASVAASDAGTYCVKVSGTCGSVTNCATLIVLIPRITVAKVCPPVPVTPGGVLVFSGTVSNSGTVTLTNVLVVNNRPANNTPVFGPLTLAAGQATNFIGSYVVATDFCGPAVDTLTARANAVCTGNLIADTASAACPVLTTPALGLVSTCPPAAVARGETLFYHGSVSNAGNATLTNVIVSSSLPTNNSPVFAVPGLAPGEVLEFDGSFVVPLGQCGATVGYTLTASAQSVCNGTNVTKSVAQVCPVSVTPRLVVTQNCPPSPVPPGGVLTFSGTVSNAGNMTLTNVFVVNDQPSNNTPLLGPITLAPNQSTNFSGSYQVYAQACQPYVNTLTATGAQVCNGSNVIGTVTRYCPGSSSPQIGLRVDCPSPPPLLGQLVFYSGSVSNAGDVPLHGVALSDNHSGFITEVDALAAGETADFFSFYLATNCGPAVITTVTAVGADACTGVMVNRQVSVGCPITCTVQRPVLVNVRTGGGQFQFTWDTVSGYSYAVQRSDAVAPTNWQSVTNYPGTGGPVTFTSPPASPKQFYRVLVQ